MSDECRFDIRLELADEVVTGFLKNCSLHDSPIALCSHAAAALQARVADNEKSMVEAWKREDALKARVRELEADVIRLQNSYDLAYSDYEKQWDRADRADATVGRLREACKETLLHFTAGPTQTRLTTEAVVVMLNAALSGEKHLILDAALSAGKGK